jgi:hypothetical protein
MAAESARNALLQKTMNNKENTGEFSHSCYIIALDLFLHDSNRFLLIKILEYIFCKHETIHLFS